MKEIDEKNKKLLSLKIATGKISTVLIDERTRLQKEIDECQRLEEETAEKNKNTAKTKE